MFGERKGRKMNTSQINCFLKASECLNFTRAAEALYMTQPVLSRQIAALEKEIGVTLFVRERNSIRLSEAGKVFAEGLSRIHSEYLDLIKTTQNTATGLAGNLVVGTAEGQLIGSFYNTLFYKLWQGSPGIMLQMAYLKHLAIENALNDGTIDCAIISELEAETYADVDYIRTRSDYNYLVVPADHPAAKDEYADPSKFKDETFIALDPGQSPKIAEGPKKFLKNFGPNMKIIYAPNISTLSLWAETGVGITAINGWHMLRNSEKVKFLKIDGPLLNEVIVWKRENQNPTLKTFIEVAKKEYIK